MPLRQTPVHSPLPVRALVGGLQAALGGADDARRRVEERIREHFGARGVLLTDSGTTALRLALAAAVDASGDGRVALPAYGCYDLATAAQGAGADVVLYDLDPRNLGPDPASLRRALGGSPVAALVLVHLYGVPVDLAPVLSLADEGGVPVVEDAAQGVGGSYGGRPLGAWGRLSVLSFGRGKGLTGGGGGALLARDLDGQELLAAIADRVTDGTTGWGRLAAAAGQWMLSRPGLYGLPAHLPFLRLGETIHHPPHPPAGPPAASLGILEGTWDASLEEASLRRDRGSALREVVSRRDDLGGLEVPRNGEPGYLRFPVLAETAAARARLDSPDARHLGIMPGYPRPLGELSDFTATAAPGSSGEERWPGAARLARDLFTVPVHGRLSPAAWQAAVRLLRHPAS